MYHRYCALVAQSVEHIHGKDEVNGSIPFEGLFQAGLVDFKCAI